MNPEATVEGGVSYPAGCRRSGSFRISESWYYFKANGVMLVSSWKKQGGKYYYYGEDGKRMTGWLTLDGNRYYLKSTGAMAVNETVVIGGKTWSFDKNGIATETQSFINSDNARRKLDGRAEARLIEIACSPAPEGHSRWTLRLLEKEAKVVLDTPVGKNAIGRALKKTGFNLTETNIGASRRKGMPNS